MKKNKLFLILSATVISLLLSFSVFADVSGGFKTVTSYDAVNNTVRLDFYITESTAIAGYCSFKYDVSTISLLDRNSNPLPYPIPDYLPDDTTTYLRNVIVPHGDVVITNVSRDASKLLNPENGFLFFAWTIPSDTNPADATQGNVLIASAYFDVVQDKTPDVSSIVVASHEYTDTVEKWYPGVIVIDKDKKSYMFDGIETGKQYYTAEFETNADETEAPEVTPDEPEVTPDEPEVTPDEPEVAPDEPEVVPDEPEVVPDEPEVAPDEPEVAPDEPEVVPDEPEVVPENSEDEFECTCEEHIVPEIIVPKMSEAYDFSIVIEAETEKARIKWTKPDGVENINSYNIIICDEDFHVISKITGIFPVTTSYTIENLYGNTVYNVYLFASGADISYSSKVCNFKTQNYDGMPPIKSFLVTYDTRNANLFGLTSETVLYGKSPLKTPLAVSKKGYTFLGWSKDGVNIIDIEKEKIYRNTILYPVFSNEAPAEKPKYISGYSDGSFNPSGSITRAEAATIISRIHPDFNPDETYCQTFTDCKKNMWYRQAVAFCASNGFINGYEDKTFRPDGSITRAEFSAILVRVFGFENIIGTNVFSDIDGHWSEANVSVLYRAGVITPYKDGTFRPDEKLTREDAVMMVNRCLGIIPDRDSIIESIKENGYRFTDVPQYLDSFFDIMSAVKD